MCFTNVFHDLPKGFLSTISTAFNSLLLRSESLKEAPQTPTRTTDDCSEGSQVDTPGHKAICVGRASPEVSVLDDSGGYCTSTQKVLVISSGCSPKSLTFELCWCRSGRP